VVYKTVTMNWDDYDIYHPGVFGPRHMLPRAEARRAFDQLMSHKAARIEMLGRLLAANGVELSRTDDGIQALNDWFLANVEADPANPGRLLPNWYSVVNDVALFLGEELVERYPGLHWEFFTWGKTDISYHRPVVMGFDRLPNPKYNVDVDRVVNSYAYRIIVSRGSVGHQGTVTARGIEFDLDEISARHRDDPIEEGAFLGLVKGAESLWRGELPEPAREALRIMTEQRRQAAERRRGRKEGR
jgi:hypothetical protein